MRRIALLITLIAAGATGVALAGSDQQSPAPDGGRSTDDMVLEFSPAELRKIHSHAPLPEVPDDPTNHVANDPAAAHFGQYLFFDTRLSSNGAVSCATCHDPQQGFSNGRRFGEGTGTTHRHTQSLWNVAHNRWYYWSGAADTLWSQAVKPIEGVDEMNSSRLAVAHLIAGDEELRAAYEHIFGALPDLSDTQRFPRRGKPPSTKAEDPDDPLIVAWQSMASDDQHTINTIFANVGKAIAAYERRIISRDAPFDRFVRGLQDDDSALKRSLSPAAQRGLKLFIGEANCRLCHTGPNFTDGEFHSLGLPRAAGALPRDPGRMQGIEDLRRDPFNAAGPYSDERAGPKATRIDQLVRSPEQWGQFKTPSLRSVATSPPYMHRGQFESLEDVVHFYSTLQGRVQMGHHQETILQPLHLDEQQQRDLIAFLKSLTGAPLDPSLTRPPASPLPADSN